VIVLASTGTATAIGGIPFSGALLLP